MAKRPTIKQIAEQCDLSLSTVSLALRNKPGIPPETRQRVLETAKALDYRTKPAHNGNGKHHLTHIGVIVKSQPDDIPQANPFYSQVLAGIELACRQHRLNLLYATMPVNQDNVPVEMPRLLIEDRMEGLLLVGAFVDETLTHVLGRKQVPVVLVDAYSQTNEYDAVVSENFQGAYQAVSHLIQNGHRQIGLIASHPYSYPSLLERRRGYLQALQDHHIAETYIADCALDKEKAFDAATELLRQHPKITALFGCNDEVAIAAMRAAQSLNRRLPDDLSVIGFDDISLAEHVVPPLTTMKVDKIGMGQLAVETLLRRAAGGPETASTTTAIRPRLIERDSVRKIIE